MLWRLWAAHLYNCIAVISPPSQHDCDSLLAVKRVQTVRFHIFFFLIFRIVVQILWCRRPAFGLIHSQQIYFEPQDAFPPSIRVREKERERVIVCAHCELDESCCASRHRRYKILTANSCEMGNEWCMASHYVLRIAFIFLHLFKVFAFIFVGSTSRACKRTCMCEIWRCAFHLVTAPLNMSRLNRTQIHLAKNPTPCNHHYIYIYTDIEYVSYIIQWNCQNHSQILRILDTEPRPLPLCARLTDEIFCSSYDFAHARVRATTTTEKLDMLGYEWGDFSGHRIECSDWLIWTFI